MREATLVNVWKLGPDVHTHQEMYVLSFDLQDGSRLNLEAISQESIDLARLLCDISKDDLGDAIGPRFSIPGMVYELPGYGTHGLDKFVINISKEFPYMKEVLCYAVHSA